MKAMNVSCRTLLVLLVIVFVGMGTVACAAVPQVGDVIVGTAFAPPGIGIANWSTSSLTTYLGRWASDLAYGPDGDLYAAWYAGGTVDRYRGDTLIETYAGLTGTSIAVRSDGTVMAIDTAAQAVMKWSGTGWVNFASGPALTDWGRMTFGPDGKLYVATADGAGVYRTDGQTGGTLTLFASKSGMTPQALAFRPTDGKLYVGSGSLIHVFNGSTGAYETYVGGDFSQINDLMWGPDRSGDGVSDLYIAAPANQGVWATASGQYPYAGYVYAAGAVALETTPVPEPSAMLALSVGVVGLIGAGIRRRK